MMEMAHFKATSVLPRLIDDVARVVAENKNRTIIWFGYVFLVDVVNSVLNGKGYRLDFIVDNDRRKWGRVTCSGLIVAPPEPVLKNAKKNNPLVLIFSNYAAEIEYQLGLCGYSAVNIHRFGAPHEYCSGPKSDFLSSVSGLRQMTLREVQLTELEILKALRDYCDTNDLRYYLAGGTCFGAVNYKGFVPWDDDIDIYMPYEDYMELIEKFPKNGRYEILHWNHCDGFFWPYAQMADNDTKMFYGSVPLCAEQGLFIDIIPLTGYPGNSDEIRYRLILNAFVESKWRYYYNAKDIVEVRDDRENLWSMRYDMPFETSENAATAVELWGGEEQWILPRGAFDYGRTLEFEGERFSAMMDCEAYLSLRARKYAGKPKEAVQVSHPICAYRR
jgi:phosphorylcholine metabolism protein LicD